MMGFIPNLLWIETLSLGNLPSGGGSHTHTHTDVICKAGQSSGHSWGSAAGCLTNSFCDRVQMVVLLRGF